MKALIAVVILLSIALFFLSCGEPQNISGSSTLGLSCTDNIGVVCSVTCDHQFAIHVDSSILFFNTLEDCNNRMNVIREIKE